MPLPADFANRPELGLGLDLFWNAYWDLVASRNDATGFIPWETVQFWANTYALDEDTARDLHYSVREMDRAWIAHKGTTKPIEKPAAEQQSGNRRDIQRKFV